MPQPEQTARHTEGPFEVLSEGHSIVVSGGPNNDDLAEFFYADEATVQTTRAEALANAHLFKAAPLMLAALEELADAVSMTCNGLSTDADHYERLERAEFKAHAAIKAAKP